MEERRLSPREERLGIPSEVASVARKLSWQTRPLSRFPIPLRLTQQSLTFNLSYPVTTPTACSFLSTDRLRSRRPTSRCPRPIERTNEEVMPVSALRAVSKSQNGVGAFILQCKRMEFNFCDWAGSSKGMRHVRTCPIPLPPPISLPSCNPTRYLFPN